jgi:hypothetical protein
MKLIIALNLTTLPHIYIKKINYNIYIIYIGSCAE